MDNLGQVPAVGAAAFCTFPRAAGAAGFPVRCFANREREFSSGGDPPAQGCILGNIGLKKGKGRRIPALSWQI